MANATHSTAEPIRIATKQIRITTEPIRIITELIRITTELIRIKADPIRITTESQFMAWIQKEIQLPAKTRGFHLITSEILNRIPEIASIKTGLAHIHIKHTSAGLTLNENADPSVRRDFETHFNRMVPEDTSLFEHNHEGSDDMTSHIKSSILGHSVTIPITDGRFNLGTWQGIYLCEHRNRAHSRKLVVTVMGE